MSLDSWALPTFSDNDTESNNSFYFFVGEAFANHLLVTSLSVSGVVLGEGGGGGVGYFFNLHFGNSFSLDHREEELQFKISLTHVLHCLRKNE